MRGARPKYQIYQNSLLTSAPMHDLTRMDICRRVLRSLTSRGIPAKTRHTPNAGSMPGHCLQRWPSIEPALGRHLGAGHQDHWFMDRQLRRPWHFISTRTDYIPVNVDQSISKSPGTWCESAEFTCFQRFYNSFWFCIKLTFQLLLNSRFQNRAENGTKIHNFCWFFQ